MMTLEFPHLSVRISKGLCVGITSRFFAHQKMNFMDLICTTHFKPERLGTNFTPSPTV